MCGQELGGDDLVQGHLAHVKQPLPLGPPQGPRHVPTVGSLGGDVSCERGTPVRAMCYAAQDLVVKEGGWSLLRGVGWATPLNNSRQLEVGVVAVRGWVTGVTRS